MRLKKTERFIKDLNYAVVWDCAGTIDGGFVVLFCVVSQLVPIAQARNGAFPLISEHQTLITHTTTTHYSDEF